MSPTHKIRLVTEGLWLVQAPKMHSVTTDAVILAAFAKIPRGKLVADLGCGNGPLGLLLLARKDAPEKVVATDILPEACELARQSAALSGLSARLLVVQGDYRQAHPQLPAGGFGLVICNPPYFSPHRQQLAASPLRANARHELTASLRETLTAAQRLLCFRGRLALCLPPARLGELCAVLEELECPLKRLQLVYPRQGKGASLCLAEGVRKGQPGTQILPPLYLHEADGSYTQEALAYYGAFSMEHILARQGGQDNG